MWMTNKSNIYDSISRLLLWWLIKLSLVLRNKGLRVSNKSMKTLFPLGYSSTWGVKRSKATSTWKSGAVDRFCPTIILSACLLNSAYQICSSLFQQQHNTVMETQMLMAPYFQSCRDRRPLAISSKTHATQPEPPTPHRPVIDDHWRLSSSFEPGWPP